MGRKRRVPTSHAATKQKAIFGDTHEEAKSQENAETAPEETRVLMQADVVFAFSNALLAHRYDAPVATPDCHKEWWEMCCADDKQVAIAAPREHAKSTAITHAYTLAMVLFRYADHVLIVSDTEGQASDFLEDIAKELKENEDLIAEFGVKKFIKDSASEIIVQMRDGHQFRIIAKGSEQKVRGIKWNNKRPNLIIGDDLENDEMVESKERREKFRKWFFRALVPCGSKRCKIRVVGTILHLDSLLERLLNDSEWVSKRYSAHKGFDDFSEILWPESWPAERLRAKRDQFLNQGDAEGYSKEYLNIPTAEGETYFRKEDFLEMTPEDYRSRKSYFAAADFAISEKEKADYTVIMVGGVDSEGFVHIVDVRRERMDSKRIIDELISVQSRYQPGIFTFESEKIDKAIGPFLKDAMRKTGVYLNINRVTPSKSKTTRGKSIQMKMRAGGVKFDKTASWYPILEAELMTITPEGPKGTHDDMFDAFAYIGLTIDEYLEAPTDEELEEEDYYEMQREEQVRNAVTGY